jgi:hypothetical protein
LTPKSPTGTRTVFTRTIPAAIVAIIGVVVITTG